MKVTPKSCSCSSCKFGKHTKYGHAMRNFDERSVRQEAKASLHKAVQVMDYDYLEGLDIPVAPIGNYYD